MTHALDSFMLTNADGHDTAHLPTLSHSEISPRWTAQTAAASFSETLGVLNGPGSMGST